MTRQMADDEVLRVLDENIADAALVTPGDCQTYDGLRSVRDYVAALQAERDALLVAGSNWQRRAERAESVLDALRGQVAGLVAEVDGRERKAGFWFDQAMDHLEVAETAIGLLRELRGRIMETRGPNACDVVKRTDEFLADLAALLAIKERMG